ncbi:MAG: hypothetical protein ACI837_001591 [Crocinitomicaceae bacterium]|jgi:hypothetical protein
MKYTLPFNPKKAPIEIEHGDKIALLGSCFSDSMKVHFELEGFETLSNPFGTIFHPDALATCLESSIRGSKEIDFYIREDLYFAWDAASHIYGMSEKSLTEKLIEKRESTKEYLLSAKVLVITFGTSWGYVHNELNKVVANCHKADSNSFTKELTEINGIVKRWSVLIEEIKNLNPNLHIIFTVSPVRHVKDGLIENNRSKARLIEAVHALTNEPKSSYFPSYEIVIDQLRDYRFYNADLVHPSAEAIEEVWQAFRNVYFSEASKKKGERVVAVNRSNSHRPLHPESNASKEQKKQALQAKQDLSLEFPETYWT